MSGFIADHWAAIAGVLGLAIWGARLWAKRQRIRAEAVLARAELTPDKQDDIEARAVVAEAKALEDALEHVPLGGSKDTR